MAGLGAENPDQSGTEKRQISPTEWAIKAGQLAVRGDLLTAKEYFDIGLREAGRNIGLFATVMLHRADTWHRIARENDGLNDEAFLDIGRVQMLLTIHDDPDFDDQRRMLTSLLAGIKRDLGYESTLEMTPAVYPEDNGYPSALALEQQMGTTDGAGQPIAQTLEHVRFFGSLRDFWRGGHRTSER